MTTLTPAAMAAEWLDQEMEAIDAKFSIYYRDLEDMFRTSRDRLADVHHEAREALRQQYNALVSEADDV